MTRTTREVIDKLSPFSPEPFATHFGIYAPQIADALNSYGKMQDEIEICRKIIDHVVPRAALDELKVDDARETIRELCEALEPFAKVFTKDNLPDCINWWQDQDGDKSEFTLGDFRRAARALAKVKGAEK